MDGFAERHGGLGATPTPEGLVLSAADGTVARLELPFPPWRPQSADLAGLLADLAGQLVQERRLAALLVRRGGYAAVQLSGRRVLASKVGTRYVQGRTAAGGWSQQRFARRRDKQTEELIGAAVEVAARLLAPADGFQFLVTGGDRALVERALADPRLRALARLPRGPHLPVGDPRADVVAGLPELLRSARITLLPPAP